jgi:hypothetical protein
MQIFLCYASEDHEVAEQVQLALIGAGHFVFFDKESLPAGGDYHARIQAAVNGAEMFIFLISPDSVAQGSYALTELKHARTKWAHPKDRVIPAVLRPTEWNRIPNYLKTVTVLEPEGNIAAEVLSAVNALAKVHTTMDDGLGFFQNAQPSGKPLNANYRIQIIVAVLGLIGVLGAALIANWDKIFRQESAPVAVESGQPVASSVIDSSMKGPDTGMDTSPTINTECPEITIFDTSKYPPESRIERRCIP